MANSVSRVTKATCENGALHLRQSLALEEQQRVWVLVLPVTEPTFGFPETVPPNEILHLAAQVYEDLSPDDVNEIEHIALDRSRFFAVQE